MGSIFFPKEALRAGGTLSITKPSPLRRAWLTVELALLYVGAPLAMISVVHEHRLPVFVALVPVLAVVMAFLLLDRTFSLKRELTHGFGWATMVSILAVFVVGGGAVALYIWHYHPSWLFEFPRNRPETYMRIMLLYPAMSVVVQEFVDRTVYFHRYGPLFGKAWWLAILLNGALFGFGHIVIGTQLAVLGTMATGTLFAVRYALTRSFWAVFFEHTLWGALVFTVGLGRFFFTGVPILGWRW
ncbi:MAG: CPBP family glutamic-type intramembrane protease [Hyphomicrobium sp.]